jgi:hypothetical protein
MMGLILILISWKLGAILLYLTPMHAIDTRAPKVGG